MATGISRVSVLAEASLASYPAITAELEAAHAAAGAAMRREFERQQLAAIMETGECPETVTLYKSQSCGKSEASAWRGIFGLPEPATPPPPRRDPRGNRAQRRRLKALARRR